MQGTQGQLPPEALPGLGGGLGEDRALTEGILALGLCTEPSRLLEVLLGQASRILPTPHWAVARAVPGERTPDVTFLAVSPALRQRGGEGLLRGAFPLDVAHPFSRALVLGKQTAWLEGAAEVPTPYRAEVPIQNLLGIPLVLEGSLQGVLFGASLEGEPPLQPWPSQLEHLENLARVATLALHRLETGRELAERLAQVEGLNQKLQEVQSLATQGALEGDPVPFLQHLLELIAPEAQIAMAWLLAPEGDHLELAAVHGLEASRMGPRLMPLTGDEAGPSSEAVRTGRAVTVLDVATDARFTSFRAHYLDSGIRSIHALPMQGERRRVLGALTLYGEHPGGFPREQVAHLEAFGSLASLVVERALLWSELQRELQQRIESELRYRVLVEESRLGVFLLQEGRVVYANRTAHHLLDRRMGELQGQDLRTVLGENDPGLPPMDLLDRVRGHQLIVRGQEGASRPLELHLGRITVGGHPALLGTLEDITERFLAQEAMRHATLQAESLLKATQALTLADDEESLLQVLFEGASTLVPMGHWWFNALEEGRSYPITRAWTPSLDLRVGRDRMEAPRTTASPHHWQRVYVEHRRVYVRDLQEESYFPLDVVTDYDMGSYVCLPLVSEGLAVGALNGCTATGEALATIEEDQLQALESLCASAAMALLRLKANRAEREAARLAEAVAQGIQAMARARAESELLLVLMEAAVAVTDLPHWWVNAFDAERKATKILGANSDRTGSEGAQGLHGHHWRQVFEEGRPLLVVDAWASDQFPPEQLEQAPHRTFVAIPLAGENAILGSLSGGTFGEEGPREVPLAQIQALYSLCSSAALVWTRLRAENELTRSEARFRQLFEGAGDGVLLTHEGVVMMANPSAARLFGVPREALVGRSTTSLTHPYQPDGRRSEELLLSIRQAVGRGDRVTEPLTFMRPDGAEVHTEVSASPVREGERVLVQAILRDVTEARRTQAEKAALERQLFQAQKMESMGVLAGGIAHDFNNLLMGVLGHVGLALDKLGPEHPVVRNLEAVQKAGQRAADLTRQMLAYSGRGQFLIRPLDLGAQVEELLKLLEVSIPKAVELRLDLAHHLPAVAADASQMHQVIMNLVLNAAEAIGEEGGVIHLRTGLTHLDHADLRELVLGHETQPGPFVFLEVEDTGCGMDEGTLGRIFEPFFTTKFTGRGLGLAALVGIVKGHRGALAVSSRPAAGTTFRIHFPAMTLPAQPALFPSLAPHPEGQGVVLVVDDEEIVRSVARQALEARGYQVEEAPDGLDAVRLVSERGKDLCLVLLDMTMPRLGGEGAFRRIRELAPELPVILSSGYTEQDALSRFQVPGLRGFIQKPYSPRELVRKIQEALGEAE